MEDPKKPSWYRTSPLDIGHLDRLLDKKFTPLLKLVLKFLNIILDANFCILVLFHCLLILVSVNVIKTVSCLQRRSGK